LKRNILFVASFLFAILLVCGCRGKEKTSKKVVTVTIEPQRYFAEKIAGNLFVIRTLVPVGQSPETYDPSPQQMVDIANSKAYFRIGFIGFEQTWMKKIEENNKGLRIFDLSEGMKFENGSDEAHHHNHGVDPHIWCSIEGARVIAWNTLNAFISLDKEHTAVYWKNYNRLINHIDSLSYELHEQLTPLAYHSFIIYHPTLTYFAHEFNLSQLPLEVEGKEPSAAQMTQLVNMARLHRAKAVFIQPEFDRKNAELLAKEAHCRLFVINPLAYDWDVQMRKIAQSLVDAETR